MVDQALMDKLRKLQSLAERAGTVNEAAVATAKLQALLMKHNLDLHSIQMDRNRSGDYITEDYGVGGKSMWKRSLIHNIATQYFCSTVYRPNTDQVIIVGEPHNIQAVKFSFELISAQLVRICEKEWREVKNEDLSKLSYNEQLLREQQKYEPLSDEWFRLGRKIIEDGYVKRTAPNAKSWKNSFFVGAVNEIRKRLSEQRKQFTSDEQGKALVLVKEDEISEAVRRLIGKTRAGSTRSQINQDGYERGKRAGRTIGMEREVTGGVRSLRDGR